MQPQVGSGTHTLRQTPSHTTHCAPAALSSVSSSAMLAPILLDDVQGAAVFGVGKRTFLELQNEAWFPPPRMLGPRLKRHVYSELVGAVAHMPRQTVREQPAQLVAGRIEKQNRTGGAT